MNQREHKKRAEEHLANYAIIFEQFQKNLSTGKAHSANDISLSMTLVGEARELAAVHALLAQIPDPKPYIPGGYG